MAHFFAVFAVVTSVLCSLGTAHAQPGPQVAPTAPRFTAAALAPALQPFLNTERAAARFQEAVPTTAPKKRDRLWNGLLIGAGVGLGAGALAANADSDDCEPGAALVCGGTAGVDIVLGTVAGAGVGLLLDAIW